MQQILIIDDEPTFTKTLEPLLSHEEYRITVAASAKEGLERIREDRPDLVLLDIGMPDVDGMEFLRKQREEDEAAGRGVLPVLILTNYTDMEKVSEGVELGVRGYVVKIAEDLDNLAKRIRDILASEERKKARNA